MKRVGRPFTAGGPRFPMIGVNEQTHRAVMALRASLGVKTMAEVVEIVTKETK